MLLGFGISKPQHVRDAIAADAAGATTGSAITKFIAGNVSRETSEEGNDVLDVPALRRELTEYVETMKAAMRTV